MSVELDEAKDLARAIDLDVVHSKTFNLRKIYSGTFLSEGHLEELKVHFDELEVELAIFNHPLSPVQQRNLERFFKIKVIDRTGLILEIFGARAQTREGVLQVQHAHLKYQKSRLVRSWTHLERQRGGRGFLGGPGETQIESDRRAIDEQISTIEERIEKVRKTRKLQRQGRTKSKIPVVALLGYTNAGKSTLFNLLSGANVLSKDMLFATLDPTMRKVVLPKGMEIVLSDTVGFISDLPTELVAAFRATLEEVVYADIILHVRDISNPDHVEQAKDVYEVLDLIDGECDNKSRQIVEVYNKIDLINDPLILAGLHEGHQVSAATGAGVGELLAELEKTLKPKTEIVTRLLEFQQGQARAWLYDHALILSEEASEQGYWLKIEWNQEFKSRFYRQFGPIFGDDN